MMKMDEVAGSGNDEFYTPDYAIYPIIQRIPTGAVVWCPFDTEASNFVRLIRAAGFRVMCSHLDDGCDFFTSSPPDGTTHIISNPPYSTKFEVFSRLFSIGLPFAMLVGVVGLFESDKRFTLFEQNDFEVMYFNKRISYFKNYADPVPSLNPPFSSVYITRGMLESRIVFERVNKNPVVKLPEWLK